MEHLKDENEVTKKIKTTLASCKCFLMEKMCELRRSIKLQVVCCVLNATAVVCVSTARIQSGENP